MESRRKIAIALVAAQLAAVGAGCGSSGSSSSDSSSSGEASAEFIRPGKKNGIATYGKEADNAEREAASRVLEENLQARADGNWSAQCASLSALAIREIERASSGLGGAGCANSLKSLAQPLARTKLSRANNMTGPIAALRVEGNKGFALYHGTNDTDYAMPLLKEKGKWKVAAVLTQEIPKGGSTTPPPGGTAPPPQTLQSSSP